MEWHPESERKKKMMYEKAKADVERLGAIVTEDNETIVVKQGYGNITYYKRTGEYKAVGYGGPLNFTTFPIYEPWRKMIIAWKREYE